MRIRKSTKKVVALLSMILILIFNVIPVFATDEQDDKGRDTRVAVTSPKVYMEKIVVYPTYVSNDGSISVYDKGYTYYRSGNNIQGVFCTVTPEQVESMKEAIRNKGYVQSGYEINVFYKMTGDFRQGMVITRQPANVPRTPVGPNTTYYTTFYTDIDNPVLIWDAYFDYLYNNKWGTQLMQASVYF
ncbi:hypothetical protein [Dorea sp. D27]|uniref:hypothetical protein n=1 Tax=Dorea sp. D27 TaxID=658665 RepID=UPI0006738096|nr:hypothetical protein [Dorea sp. D27]